MIKFAKMSYKWIISVEIPFIKEMDSHGDGSGWGETVANKGRMGLGNMGPVRAVVSRFVSWNVWRSRAAGVFGVQWISTAER